MLFAYTQICLPPEFFGIKWHAVMKTCFLQINYLHMSDDKTLSIPEATYEPCPTLISVDALKRLNSNQHLKGGCIFAGTKDLEMTIEMLIPNKTCSFFHKLLTEPAALLSLSRLLTCHAAIGSDDFKRRSSSLTVSSFEVNVHLLWQDLMRDPVTRS